MPKNKLLIFFFILTVLAVSFQLFNLTKMSLWHDEAFSGLLVQYDLKEMLYRISLDVHPPLYYLILKAWVFFFSWSLFSIRFFSLTFGLLTAVALYFLAKKLFQNNKLAVFAASLLILSSFQIQYNMEARMYTLAAFFIVLSSFSLLQALEKKRRQDWFFYALLSGAAIYTHYYAVFWIMAQAIYLICRILKEAEFNLSGWLKNKDFRFAVMAYGLVFLSYLPWLKTFLRQLNQVEQSYWIPAMNIWSIPNTLLSLTAGSSTDPARFWWLLIFITIIVVSAAIYFLIKIKNQAKWLVFLLAFFPFPLAALVSLKTSIYLDRYFIFSLPFYLLFLTAVIFSLENRILRNSLMLIAVIGTLVSFPVRWQGFDLGNKPGMAAAADFLNQEVKPDKDKVFVGSSFVYFTFKYYNKTGLHPLLFASNELAHFSGTALLNTEDTFSDFNTETKKGDVVWMINTTGFGNYQPSLPENWLKEEEKGFEDSYNYRGWIIVSKYQVE